LTAANYTVVEHAGAVIVSIRRGGDGPDDISVGYAVTGGSAVAGEDFEAQMGSIVFHAGETVKTLTIPIVDDCKVEGEETFQVTLNNPSNGTSLGAITTAEFQILDDDRAGSRDVHFVPPPQLTLPVAVQPEGKILLARNFVGGPSNASTIVRLNADASIDASFDAREAMAALRRQCPAWI